MVRTFLAEDRIDPEQPRNTFAAQRPPDEKADDRPNCSPDHGIGRAEHRAEGCARGEIERQTRYRRDNHRRCHEDDQNQRPPRSQRLQQLHQMRRIQRLLEVDLPSDGERSTNHKEEHQRLDHACHGSRVTSWSAWPSGSRIRNPFVNPRTLSGNVTTPDDRNCAASRSIAAAASTSETTNLVCQYQRSVGCESAGMGRPAAGNSYSKNSTPGGPTTGFTPVTRTRAPERLSKCSCSVPILKLPPATVKPSRSR